jgi:hypothetical protein
MSVIVRLCANEGAPETSSASTVNNTNNLRIGKLLKSVDRQQPIQALLRHNHLGS